MSRYFLAFDLGAESGRAMLGRYAGGVISVREIHRFANEGVRMNGSLQWDILRIWAEVKRAFDLVDDVSLESVGLDTWGVDYALLGERGSLLENPYHYRDTRTDGMMDAVFERVSRERIYAVTGIQFLPINTLFQLYAACVRTPDLIDASRALVTIPDLLNYWLTGTLQSEYTVATTTQFIDARSRSWALRMLDEIGLPRRLLQPLVEPGAVIGPLLESVSRRFRGTPVVAPACHDTASAVASVALGEHAAFLSSGTWSLLGCELPAPIISSAAMASNFTNEGGVAGTTRLLKNIGGLWLLQACLRHWSEAGQRYDYDTLLAATDDDQLAFRSLIDPDCRAFLHPDDMPGSIAGYCRQTGQPEPSSPAAFTRTILESLVFKYRAVLESMEELTGRRFAEVRIIGGGARNRLLTQWTADATQRTVVAGPVEATALGNLAMQLIATGHASSIEEARAIVDRSFPIQRFEPRAPARWESHYKRFREYMEFTCA